MCGILGFVGQRDELTGKRLSDSLRTLENRGPDASSTWVEGDVWLGHTRLSIIDSRGGAQPMISDCGSVIVSYNGEIYNYKELKAQYRYDYQTRCDTEVLIAGYLNKGIEFLSDLRGMYAFCLYDMQRKKVFISRDPFGIKPLVYSLLDENLLFASEIKALLPNLGVLSPDRNQVQQSLIRKFVPSPWTAYKDVMRLKRGETLEYNVEARTHLVFSFWDSYVPRLNRVKETESCIRQTLTKSVERHLVSDVPVSLFLSGGIDSSVIAASLPNNSLPIKSYTVGLSGKTDDEDVIASRQVASEFGLLHSELMLKPLSVEDIVNSIAYFDEPFADTAILATNMLAKAASEVTRVALTGDGGDEMYYGYPVYRTLSSSGAIPSGLCRFLLQKMFWSKHLYAMGVSRAPSLTDRYTGMYYGLASTVMESLLGQRITYTPPLPHVGTPKTLRNYDLETNLPDYYLQKIDKLSMYHSLEVRVPFLDLDSFAAVEQFPMDQHFDVLGSKAILRKHFANSLASAVTSRRKQGMLRDWRYLIGDNLEPLMREYVDKELIDWIGIQPGSLKKIFRHKSALKNTIQWRLLVLGIWLKHNRHHLLLN